MNAKTEIKANFDTFTADWQASLGACLELSEERVSVLSESYERLTTLQAWRAYLLDGFLPEECSNFFAEAQNDALISHVQAACGSWRVALKALRSCIENSLLTLYFKDHPVELRHWEQGRFRLGFTDNINYLKEHYLFQGMPEGVSGLGIVHQEYSKLSQAVHASSRQFRMTEDGKVTSLWANSMPKLNVWSTHERRTLHGINLIFLVIFRDKLQGTAQSALRETLSRAIPKSKDGDIRTRLGVRIKR